MKTIAYGMKLGFGLMLGKLAWAAVMYSSARLLFGKEGIDYILGKTEKKPEEK